jgi:very-short-patch-repair endonuclease
MARGDPRESPISAVCRPLSGSHPSEVEIELSARAKHGVLTVAELESLGLSDRAVRHRAACGRLHRIHHGVYAVERLSDRGRWMGAVLASGPAAVLSHTSAGALWGIAADVAVVHVTVSGRTGTRRRGVAHHGSALDADEVTQLDGIPSTTVARTLLDLAATVGRARVERAVDRAEELRLFDLGEVERLLDRRRGERGTRLLSSVLAGYDDRASTRSPAEERLLALVERARLPRAKANAWIPLPDGDGYRPDFLWAERRLIVEVDGRTYHARRQAFEHDRRRDRRLALAGYETRRYSAREVLREPERVIAELEFFLTQPSPGVRAP